jgi:uncharacterized repeat protein (TIGR01451 family)
VFLLLTVAAALVVAAGADGQSDASLLGASEKRAACSGPLNAPCSQVQYEIMLANAGGALNPVMVTDPLPPGVEYMPRSATNGLRYEPDTRTMHWEGSLRTNSIVTMSFEVNSMTSKALSVTNAASICVGLAPDYDCITRSVTLMLDPGPFTPSPTPTWTPTPSATASPPIPTTFTATPPVPTISPTPTVPSATPADRRQFLPLIVRLHPLPPPPTATPTPSWPVSFDAIWLEGPKGTQNHEFRRCDVIYEWVQLTNHSNEPALVSLDWRVHDWAGRYVASLSYVNWQLWWPSGSYQANLPRAIPDRLGYGPYELSIKLWNEQGLVAERILYFTLSDEGATSSPLAEWQTCQGIAGDGLPAGMTERFSVNDPAVFGWAWWQRGGNVPHTVRWVWITPDGNVYDEYEEEYTEECTFYSWAWLEIAGADVAEMPGLWTLDLYYDGEPVASRRFEIVDENSNDDNAGVAATGGGYMAGACGAPYCGPWPPR